MKTQKIDSVAVIGLGSIGRRHLRILKKLRPNIKVIAVRSGLGQPCEEDQLVAQKVSSVQEAIRLGIDAAFVCGPATTHVEQLNALTQVGIPTFLEKPVADSMSSVEKIGVLASSTTPAPVLVGYVLRHDPSANKFFEIINSGAVGNLIHARIECGSFLPQWRPGADFTQTVSARRDLGGGVLLELSHEIDYAQWFFGDVKAVYGVTPKRRVLGLEVEEMVEAILETENLHVSLNINFNTVVSKRECRVFADKGTVRWDAIAKKVELFGNNGAHQSFEFDPERDSIYEKQILHFEDCVLAKTSPKVSLKDGVSVMKVIEALRTSIESGRKVKLT